MHNKIRKLRHKLPPKTVSEWWIKMLTGQLAKNQCVSGRKWRDIGVHGFLVRCFPAQKVYRLLRRFLLFMVSCLICKCYVQYQCWHGVIYVKCMLSINMTLNRKMLCLVATWRSIIRKQRGSVNTSCAACEYDVKCDDKGVNICASDVSKCDEMQQ